MSRPAISVLIPTVHRRIAEFTRLIREVNRQIEATQGVVETVALYDNKWQTVGEKRNRLLDAARGEFLTFVDDDDRLAPDYLECLLGAVRDRPDAHVVVYEVLCSEDGRPPKHCYYGVEKAYTDGPTVWTGLPSHTMLWRSEIAKRERFPEQNFGEDSDWVRRAARHVDPARQVRIDRVLYHYDFNSNRTETR